MTSLNLIKTTTTRYMAEDGQERAVMLWEQYEELVKDRERIDCLRTLMGYVECGEDTVVKLFQDDATRSYFVKAGENESYWSESFRGAIDSAMQSAKKDKAQP